MLIIGEYDSSSKEHITCVSFTVRTHNVYQLLEIDEIKLPHFAIRCEDWCGWANGTYCVLDKKREISDKKHLIKKIVVPSFGNDSLYSIYKIPVRFFSMKELINSNDMSMKIDEKSDESIAMDKIRLLEGFYEDKL